MQYVRARRLSDAARVLAGGAPNILTVALDAGYNSHEAFTRAFRDRFEQTPESVRDRGSLDGLALIEPLKLRPHSDIGVEPPSVIESPLTRLVGLSELCSFDTVITIPGQWERFMERWYDVIPDKVEGMPIGVYRPADDDGRFLYMCATKSAALANIRASSSHSRFPRGSTRSSNTAGTCPRSSRPTSGSGIPRCRRLAALWPTRQ